MVYFMALTFFPANKKMGLFKFWAYRSLQPLNLKRQRALLQIHLQHGHQQEQSHSTQFNRKGTNKVCLVNHTAPSVCIYTCQYVPLSNSKGLKLLNKSAELLPTSWGHFMLSQNSCCWMQTVRHHWTDSMENLAINKSFMKC